VSARWDFPTCEAVIRQVLKSAASLLVWPAGRLGHAGPRTLTYTDARLIEACPCPLVLLKTERVYREGAVVAAVDPGPAHDKSAELDDTIVAAAKTLSNALADAPVHIYHAVPPAEGSSAASREQAEKSVEVPLRQRPPQWVGREHETRKLAARHDLSERLVFVEVGPIESALPVYAREAHVTAVVMGAVAR
jgi:universal stress protein E